MNGFNFFIILLITGLFSCAGLQLKEKTLPPNSYLSLKWKETELSNGLRVILIEDHRVPLVSYQTWVKVGSVDEQFSKTGLAHLFEHLMFKGTFRNGPKAFFEELEAKGAEVNAYTTRDATVFHETFLPEHLDKVIELESDRLQNLDLNENLFQTERLVVLEERKLRLESSPEAKLDQALWESVFQTHPYHWPIIGAKEDLALLTLQDLKDFYKRYYQPSNVVLVIAGAINSELTIQKIEKSYGAIPSSILKREKINKEEPQTIERVSVLNEAVATSKLLIGYPITQADHEDTYSLDLLAQILYQGQSSRAYLHCVENQKIAFGIHGSSYTPKYPGILSIEGSLRKGRKIAELEKCLDEVIDQIQFKPFTIQEIAKAKKQMKVSLLEGVRTAHGLATLIGNVLMIDSRIEYLNKDFEGYEKVSVESLNQVLSRYLSRERKNKIHLVPLNGEL